MEVSKDNMPRYEYECESCGIHFERIQSFSDTRLSECPECGGPVHRLIYPVGVIFRGPGFYVTDSRGTAEGGDSKGKAAGESVDDGEGREDK